MNPSLYGNLMWNAVKRDHRSHTPVLTHRTKRVRVRSSVVQHAPHRENLTRAICCAHDRSWTNSKGHVTFLKFPYLQPRECVSINPGALCPGSPANAAGTPFQTSAGRRSNRWWNVPSRQTLSRRLSTGAVPQRQHGHRGSGLWCVQLAL